ncbi:hypothetical protein M0R45_010051 [Rubus argutus]|uniref:Uncharacterized protein n=1 Tax=Rubus argutus TaxID=59490 RepID=A0AAW1Y6H7_RUBAR
MVLQNEADGHESKFIGKIISVQMHDMIRDMGRGIVGLESNKPGERSRLWHHKDSFKVLTENNGTQTIEGLVLNIQMHPVYTRSRNSSKVVLETNAFTSMHKLRLLQLSHVQLTGCYKEFPTGLRWMCWLKFPLPSIPSDFPLESLVVLEMCHSSLRQVWTGTKYISSMKLESIERVDKEMIDLLSLSKLDPLETIMMDSTKYCGWKGTHPIQGLYERGIFSTFLPGDKVPGQFSHRSTGSSVSFTVPILANLTIRGLNMFSVIAKSNNNDSDHMTNIVNIDGSEYPTVTVVSNKSNGRTCIYGPTFYGIPSDGKDMIWLSHWQFWKRLEGGDVVTVLIYTKSEFKVKECGIQLVYYDEKDQEKISSGQLVASTLEDPCFLRAGVPSPMLYQQIDPGKETYYGGIYIDHLIRDINEKSNIEGQECDLILRLASESGSKSNSNKCGLRGWNGRLIMSTVFFRSLPLVGRSSLFQQLFQQRKKRRLKCARSSLFQQRKKRRLN